MQASGTLSSTSALRLSVSTSSLEDWLPFAAVVRGPALFPVVLNGRATFNWQYERCILLSSTCRQLRGRRFRNQRSLPLPTPLNLKLAGILFPTSIQLSFQSVALHSATLRRDDTSTEFDASATLQHGHVTGDSNFTLRANLHNIDLAALQALAGYNYPIAGTGRSFPASRGH